jgi:hypothetical protein
MKHKIIIDIYPGGEVRAKVEGVKGSSCRSLSAWLDDLGTVTADEPTSDMYEENAAVASVATVGNEG